MEFAVAQNRPGATLVNLTDITKPGSYGCVVQHESGESYILTCSHVALCGSSENRGGVVEEAINYRVSGYAPPYVISNQLYYARRDSQNDTALIKPLRIDNTNTNGAVTIGGAGQSIPSRISLAWFTFSDVCQAIRPGN